MSNYTIMADSACDITPEKLNKWNVKYIELSVRFEGEETTYLNYSLNSKEFYDKMRDGKVAKTSAINIDTFKTAFSKELEQGNDVLYLGFTSSLSGTYNASRIAAEELREDFPDRKIVTVDTLCASAGYGLLLYLTVEEKNKGADIYEAAQFAEDNKMNICHWFTVDDLVYLKRGGRISAATALVGGLLGIKPVLHMDDKGHLVNVSKVRGRKAAINAMADKIGELADKENVGTVFISHGDCIDDAKMLENILVEKYGIVVGIIADIGPVIGAHSGPGTLALFFKGRER